ncbi:MAG TPA: hypothetical protein VF023_05885, partial [Bryobacteraceae bacterium]
RRSESSGTSNTRRGTAPPGTRKRSEATRFLEEQLDPTMQRSGEHLYSPNIGRREFTNLTIKNSVTIAKVPSTQSKRLGSNAAMKA